MSVYLAPEELNLRVAELREEFERLLKRPSIARRPNSRQWLFLRHCFEVTVRGANGDFPCDKVHASQYKFEAADRLRRYYLARGEPPRFIFQIVHRDDALDRGLVDETYPCANGYVLLVVTDGQEAKLRRDTRIERELLERVVTEATDAEWAVYMKLPEVDLSPLDPVFLPDGSARQRIKHLVERHHERQWTIRHPESNPSTKRILDISLLKLEENEAWVRTREYWYLRWFSLKLGDYAQIDYQETNTQKYILVRRKGKWLVEANIYPPPTAQAPHRKKVVVG